MRLLSGARSWFRLPGRAKFHWDSLSPMNTQRSDYVCVVDLKIKLVCLCSGNFTGCSYPSSGTQLRLDKHCCYDMWNRKDCSTAPEELLTRNSITILYLRKLKLSLQCYGEVIRWLMQKKKIFDICIGLSIYSSL